MTFKKKSVILAVILASLTVLNQGSAEARLSETGKKQLTKHQPYTLRLAHQDKRALTEQDIACLEAVVYNETRGNRAQGALLVGATVINRTNNKNYPNTICGVAYQRAQFTNIQKVKPQHINEQTRSVVREIIQKYYNGTLNTVVMYFHNTTVIPRWSHKKKRIARVGAHIFYAR